MTKHEFLENFEIFVMTDILQKFESNEYISFSIDFKTKLDLYLRMKIFDIRECDNVYLAEIFVKNLEMKIFEDNYAMVCRLEKFNTSYYNIQQKFENLISILDNENLFNLENLNTIITKIENCKNSI
jgi:hypothetical protein